MHSLHVAVDLPVYVPTNDLEGVQIVQLHVLFNFAEDGLETSEIYVISSAGDRTVKDVYKLESDQAATLKFPLPEDADYIFFKPDEQHRFVKFKGGFADTSPILPSAGSSQLMVSYLVPYQGTREYSFTAPLNVARINFLLPQKSKVSLQGTGLTGPGSMTLQSGESYEVYSYADLKAGQTVSVSIGGASATESNANGSNTKNSIAIGAAFFGFAIIGVGIWWWRKSDANQDDEDIHVSATTLDGLILEIAKLDDEYAQGRLSEDAYQRLRQNLKRQAKRLL